MAGTATLHMLCGKIGAGKSTLAADLSGRAATVLISEDVWLGALFADQMTSGADYVAYAQKLRGVMEPHIAELLRAGVSVVLDFPANTIEQRAWMRALAVSAGVPHVLHYIDLPDAVCLARLRARNESGAHPFQVTEAQFHAFSKHFVPPAADEDLNVVIHGPSN